MNDFSDRNVVTPLPIWSYRRFGKRALDILASGILLVLLAPVLIAIAVLLRVSIGSPVLFRQQRPGKSGLPFEIIKFRTMLNDLDGRGHYLPDAERMTAIGSFLRNTSLDELPELWNVFKGNMSLVGPRPLLMEYLPLYSREQARRHEVRPGITGWAQVNGRNALSWEEKFLLDQWYVDHVGLALDVHILLRTVRKVFAREGISAEGDVTMPRFTGTEK